MSSCHSWGCLLWLVYVLPLQASYAVLQTMLHVTFAFCLEVSLVTASCWQKLMHGALYRTC